MKPTSWAVTATAVRTDPNGSTVVQLPTFVLPASLGLCTETSALRTARDIIGHDSRVTVDVTPA